jgi:hypothetical protein
MPIGIGCAVVGILVLVVVYVVGSWVWGKAKTTMQEAGVSIDEMTKRPERTLAKVFVKMNPDIELVSEDEAAGTMTVKIKSSGETLTMSWKDLAEGKLVVKDSAGQVVTVDSKNPDGTVVVQGPKGTTVMGANAEASQPPSWVPMHASMSLMQGGMRTEGPEGVNGMSMAESTEPISTLKTFYEEEFKKKGAKVTSQLASDEGGMLSAEFTTPKSTITVIFSKDNAGKSTVMINYNGPKE